MKQEKRIYIVDVTASMQGKGIVQTANIFDKVKSELSNAVDSINNADTEISIIPFTDRPHMAINGNTSDKTKLLDDISKIDIKKGDTNIADAWTAGISEIDSTRINYLFLLTDGLHNNGPEKEVLYERLKEWTNFAQDKYYFAFYVMLTPNAREQEICDIVDATDQMWLIESMNVNVAFINSPLSIQANIKDNKTIKHSFTTNNQAAFNQNMELNLFLEDNAFYKIENSTQNLSNDGSVQFNLVELKPHAEIPLDIQLKLHIEYDKKKYPMIFFTPEQLNFRIINKGIRKMTIKEK